MEEGWKVGAGQTGKFREMMSEIHWESLLMCTHRHTNELIVTVTTTFLTPQFPEMRLLYTPVSVENHSMCVCEGGRVCVGGSKYTKI